LLQLVIILVSWSYNLYECTSESFLLGT
jgi:hypothetical protein